MKKSICSLAVALSLISSSALGHERFSEYVDEKKKNNSVKCFEIEYYDGSWWHLHSCTIGKMKYPNYMEMYESSLKKNDKGEINLIPSDNPKVYTFDLNEDFELSPEEIFYDPLMDGWNGNEKSIKPVKKIKDIKF